MKKHKFGDSQYEAHINLGDMSQSLSDGLPKALTVIGFKTTEIITTIVSMPCEGLETEDFAAIITTKDSHLKTLVQRIKDAVNLLIVLGYKVQRYKIESTIIDSKYEDSLRYWGNIMKQNTVNVDLDMDELMTLIFHCNDMADNIPIHLYDNSSVGGSSFRVLVKKYRDRADELYELLSDAYPKRE